MAKITEIFNLGKSQAEIDFIDIDVLTDTPLFIDPHFLANRYDFWSQDSLTYIRSFFQYLLDLIRNNQIEAARAIFINLDEPNETCLGLSIGSPKGRSVNKEDVNKIFNSLVESRAVATGLVEELEDTILFVDGVGRDKLSDITTNLIKEKLITYTQSQCHLLDIPLVENVPTGFYWNAKQKRWESKNTDMLIINGKKILLVPKGIVSYCNTYTPDKYHQHFVLTYIRNEQLRLKTAFVKTRVNKKKKTTVEYVAKKDLKERLSPGNKIDLRQFTENHPAVFAEFKERTSNPGKSLSNGKISDVEIDIVADHLIKKLSSLLTGNETANEYEKIITSILELLFYPDLICPQKQVKIHNGRKRVDITFDNAAHDGSFFEFHKIHDIPCQFIMVECKNYSKDPNNPELDQLSGRFSPNRGKVGLLVFRSVNKMETLIDRCKDTYVDDRGLIIPICDIDLITALTDLKNNVSSKTLDNLLRSRARIIKMG